MKRNLVSLAVLVHASIASAADWHAVKEKNGLKLEVRTTAGQAFEEARVTTRVAMASKELCTWLWNHPGKSAAVTHEELLKNTADERLIYQQVHCSIVSDRDYTVHFRRRFDSETAVCDISFVTDNDAGPPLRPHFVRIPVIRGGWIVEPDGGGSFVTYLSYSEPGGSIPAWVTKGAQRDAAVFSVEASLANAK